MTKFITEIFKEINDQPELLKSVYSTNNNVKLLLQYAFDEKFKFALPKSNPPYTPAAQPQGMTSCNFLTEIRRLYVFTPQKELPKKKREELFIELLENIHPSEANFLCTIKNQELPSLYPNITKETVKELGWIM